MTQNDHDHWNNVWNQRQSNATWNVQEPDQHLIHLLNTFKPTNCLEIGCGTGVNARYLSKYAIVDAIDISTFAINEAKNIPSTVNYICGNFMEFSFGKKYDLIFDRGFYHGIFGCNILDRSYIAEKISSLLSSNGLWLSVIGSNQGVTKENIGPPQHNLKDILQSMEPYFNIKNIESSFIENLHREPSPVWVIIANLKK
jgi:methylase of polypeptide subunit release factors